MIRLMLGKMGCLARDTQINVNRCKKGFSCSIEHLYKQWNNIPIKSKQQWNLSKETFVRSFDGERIVLHQIEDVVYSGKKKVYLMKLENGKEIKATAKHKIQTDKGMIKLSQLKNGNNVMCDTLKPLKSFAGNTKMIYKNVGKLLYHNNLQKPYHILVYESYINNIPYDEYINILRTKKNKFKFVDTSKYVIHHIDKNHKNNELSNLKLLTILEHIKLHSIKNKYNFNNQGVPKFSKVKSITKIGIEDTYDIVCKAPHHNFVANGIVVHNSGKTACMVREMVLNEDGKTTFGNIIMKSKKSNVVQINRSMIFIDKEFEIKGKKVIKTVFNADFWKGIKDTYPDGINVVIDEAHTLMNSRRAMSSDNVIMNDFMSLLRRILGDSGGYGELTLITQMGRRLDVNARELATSVHYHVCHYKRTCSKCGFFFWETNEIYQKPKHCPACQGKRLTKSSWIIEKWEFDSMDSLDMWIDHNIKSYQKHYWVTDIEKYFKHYDTFQWENLISEY